MADLMGSSWPLELGFGYMALLELLGRRILLWEFGTAGYSV
jgi:hypothetical protein